MNPNETKELMETISFVRDHFNMTILLIEHDMKLVSGICEELTVLNFGKVLAQGPTAEVLNDPQVITAYLGRIGGNGLMAMLEAKDLNVYYGMIQAIKGISFEVNQGEVIALIGANGAGRTTTLHAVHRADTGKIRPYFLRRKRYYKSAGSQDRFYGNGTRSGRTTRICTTQCLSEPENGCLYTKRQRRDQADA